MDELDAQTLAQCQTGDIPSLGALYDCYRQSVYYVCRRMVGETDADDACQKAFVAVFPGIFRFEAMSKVVTRVCLMHLRKRRPHGSQDTA